MEKPEIDRDLNWGLIEQVIQEIVALQQKKMLACGQQIIPALTLDDAMQPNDFLELENNPLFRYEEGLLTGVQTVQMALRALKASSRI
jgi:hypothetical protein